MKEFSRLKGYLKERKWYIIVGVLALAIVDFLQLLIPKVIQYTIDGLSNDTLTNSLLIRNIFYILIIALSIAFFRFWWRYCIIGTAYKIEENLRNELYLHFSKLHHSFYQNNKIGDLMAHATNDITAVRMVFGMGAVSLFDGIGLTIASILFMLNIDMKLTLYVLIPLPIITLIVLVLGREVHKRFSAVQETFAKLSAKAQESFAGIRVIKAFTQEKEDSDHFKKISEDMVEKNIRLAIVSALFFPLMVTIIGVSNSIIILWGGISAILSKITVGEFVAFYTYLGILSWPMMAIGWVMNIYQRGKASMERINNILNTEPEIKNNDILEKIDKNFDNLKIKNLTFQYPNSDFPALININMDIKKGEKIAIVGRTGSGKTTLINLILRLYNIQTGDITINGISINNIEIKELRNLFSVVPQETFLFSETIKENIAFSNQNANIEEIEYAAKCAQIYDNILEFPDKFDTFLGEKGVNLSGGQKQRTAIARAILKDSPVVILDDALSAVDTDTEEKILFHLSNVLKNKTLIVISHRISSIKNFDKIYVLDEGKIIEQGNHEELIEKNGLYADMYNKQLLEEMITK